jgi:hypothetical protein
MRDVFVYFAKKEDGLMKATSYVPRHWLKLLIERDVTNKSYAHKCPKDEGCAFCQERRRIDESF